MKLPGDDESWDFGQSAGFYLDAVKDPWSKHYKMGTYLTKELYELIQSAFSNIVDPNRIGIMGHRYNFFYIITKLSVIVISDLYFLTLIHVVTRYYVFLTIQIKL